MAMSRALAVNDGIFTGTSGGGTVHAAVAFAKTAPPGTTIVAMLCGPMTHRFMLLADFPEPVMPSLSGAITPPRTLYVGYPVCRDGKGLL